MSRKLDKDYYRIKAENIKLRMAMRSVVDAIERKMQAEQSGVEILEFTQLELDRIRAVKELL